MRNAPVMGLFLCAPKGHEREVVRPGARYQNFPVTQLFKSPKPKIYQPYQNFPVTQLFNNPCAPPTLRPSPARIYHLAPLAYSLSESSPPRSQSCSPPRSAGLAFFPAKLSVSCVLPSLRELRFDLLIFPSPLSVRPRAS